jgi:nicotinamide phosphoribosyltransferase
MQAAIMAPFIRRLPIKGLIIYPTMRSDGYKMDHRRQYIEGTRYVTANMTPRKSRVKGINYVIVAGTQYYTLSTLVEKWTNHFFALPIDEITEDYMVEMTEYTLDEQAAMGIGVQHWKDLHALGYLPLAIRALEEGTRCPIKVPMYMVKNTHPDFFWLTNFIETDMSAETWGITTAATLSNAFREIFTKWAIKTGGDLGFVPFQGHNFSYRGMLGQEAAALVDMGHCFNFVGSDTVHGRKYLKHYYGAKQTGFNDIISCSVFATEHAVMCTSTGFYIRKNNLDWEHYGEAEFMVFKRLITELYPNGIVSIVSDTWDLWKVLVEYMVRLKDEIMARNGKVVIRPDSGNPADIMCGMNTAKTGPDFTVDSNHPSFKGVVELLWDVFGGTTNVGADGNVYKFLDSHIGAIYGDSINLERAEDICERLASKGFGSTNWVAGIGSYTYQYVTRDTFGFAQKATFAEIEIDNVMHGIEVFKDPITDDGTKKSARGRLRVDYDNNGNIFLKDQCTEEEEAGGILKLIFYNGNIVNPTNLERIRAVIRKPEILFQEHLQAA